MDNGYGNGNQHDFQAARIRLSKKGRAGEIEWTIEREISSGTFVNAEALWKETEKLYETAQKFAEQKGQ
jgi:hypothetical protein